jgi:hypothetical protein
MSDLTIPLIGLTALAGYFFSKDGKNAREVEVPRNQIEKFDKPNGSNIYTSNIVKEANDEILQRSLENYKLAENPAETGVLPPLFNIYSSVGNDTILHQDALSQTFSSSEMGKSNDLNRLKNVLGKKNITTDNLPMFKNYIGNDRNEGNLYDLSLPYEETEINLLTGKPFEKNHINMVPFFGSNVKQNMEMFSNQSLLDNRTGNTSTYKHKQEIESLYDKKPDNIYGNPVFSSQVNKDRYIPSLYRQNERPVEPERISAPISGTFDNNIRPVFKDVNELRPGNRPKETYNGRILSGKMGETRGIQAKVSKNRPDTYFENEHRFAGPGEYVAPKIREDYSTNMKNSSRQDYNIEYYGSGFNSSLLESKPGLSSVDNSNEIEAYFQEPKRLNFENDYNRNMAGTIVQNHSEHDYGKSALNIPESERASTGIQTHLLNANDKTKGVRLKLQDNAKTTLKQTTIKTDNYGNVSNSGLNFGANAPYNLGISQVDAKTTHKETIVDNKYKGQVHKNNGMGYIVNKYDAKTTGKEIVTESSKDYISNPKFANQSESRENFKNAVIRDDKQDLLMGERARGPQKFQISSGKDSQGEIKLTENMLLKEKEDRRTKLQNEYKFIPSKEQIGMVVRYRDDNEDIDTINRIQPELIQYQLQNNPYSIDTSKKL